MLFHRGGGGGAVWGCKGLGGGVGGGGGGGGHGCMRCIEFCPEASGIEIIWAEVI